MPRRPRNEQAGATYHVIGRGVERRRMFVDDEDYRRYMRLLASVTQEFGWELLCYCLMPNHVHLMIETPDTNLGKGMHSLHGLFASGFNERYRRPGHLFGNRFKSPVVTSDEAFVRLVGYIAVNPVAARLCDRAQDWPWGSHALVSSAEFAPPWLAQRRLVDRLEEMTGMRCYSELVAAWERTARY